MADPGSRETADQSSSIGGNAASESTVDGFDLDGFLHPDSSEGLSIEDLGRAYAELMDQGDDPYQLRQPETEFADLQELVDADSHGSKGHDLEVSPRSILEAMLFVGHADNQPLTSRRIASFMRGVTPEEIDDLVIELNEGYDREGAPYQISGEAGGYRMVLRASYHSLRDRFYGRIREARLSQAAIDVLSIVAYRQPVTREEVDRLRGHRSSSLLNQLVRRRLLKLETKEDRGTRIATYGTTDRFLKLFGLENLAALPQSEDLDRWTG